MSLNEQIIMGTSGTVLDWILKRKVTFSAHIQTCTFSHTHTHSLSHTHAHTQILSLSHACTLQVIDPKKISMLVLDEADVMIDQQGQQDQTIRIKKWALTLFHTHTHTPSHTLHRLLPESCQKVLFSATYSEEVMSFAKRVIPDPVTIRLKRAEESLNNIKQFYVECKDQDEKFNALANLYGVISIGQSMIFCHVS